MTKEELKILYLIVDEAMTQREFNEEEIKVYNKLEIMNKINDKQDEIDELIKELNKKEEKKHTIKILKKDEEK